MRVAVVTPDWPAFEGGGVAALSRTLAEALADAGDEIEVWTRGGGARARRLRGEAGSVPVIGFPGRAWARRGQHHWGPALESAAARFRPDAVISMTWEPLGGGWRFDGGPLWVFAHGRDITGDLDAARGEARRRVLRADLGWMCLTRWMRSELLARGASNVAVVPAAVPTVSSSPRRPDGVRANRPLRALSVGRLIPRKGQDVTIAAVRRLGGRVELRILGEGPDRGRLEVLAAGCPWIRFDGWASEADLESAWADADAFVMPARTEPGGDSEGYGLVFLEAGLRGLPVIGGRSGGVVEAVRHDRTGLLVDDPSDPAGVAAALASLAEDGALVARLGAAGREVALADHTPARLAAAVRRNLRAPRVLHDPEPGRLPDAAPEGAHP